MSIVSKHSFPQLFPNQNFILAGPSPHFSMQVTTFFALFAPLGHLLLLIPVVGTALIFSTTCCCCKKKKKRNVAGNKKNQGSNKSLNTAGDNTHNNSNSAVPPSLMSTGTGSSNGTTGRRLDEATAKSYRDRPNTTKVNKPRASISTNRRLADEDNSILHAKEEKIPPYKFAGDIDEIIKKKPPTALIDSITHVHRYDRPSQKIQRNRNGRKPKLVEEDNLLYLSDDKSKTEKNTQSTGSTDEASDVTTGAGSGRGEAFDSARDMPD